MTYYDAAMVGVIIAGMIWGAWRGITWQLASIASLVLGYVVAHPLSAQLAPKLPGEPVVARALAMLLIYAGVSGGVFLAAWIVRTTLRQLQFEAYDRHLGMVLGGLEGALVGLVATFFVVSMAPQTRTPIFSSPSGKVVGRVMAAVGPVLPTEAREALARFLDGHPAPAEVAAADPRPEAEERSSSSRREGRSRGRDRGRDRDRDRDRTADAGRESTAWQDLLEEQEKKIGKAVVETAGKELERMGFGDGKGRAVDRR